MMNRAVQLTVLLLSIFVAVSAAYGQGNCTVRTMTGTYAIQEKGSSLHLDPSKTVPPFFVGAFAPFGNVAEITFSPNGIGKGFYWIYAGTINGGAEALEKGLKAIPVDVEITEMNPNCTGKIKYLAAFGGISATVEEQVILFDNGREFRSVPTSITNGIPAVTWIGEGHRISRSSVPVNSCGPQTAHGSYLISCENVVDLSEFDPALGVNADAFLMRTDVSMTGEYTGNLYEMLGPFSVPGVPVHGTMVVNPDCSYSDTLVIPTLPATFDLRGVFFNEGKDYFGMSVRNPAFPANEQEVKYSLCRATRIGQ